MKPFLPRLTAEQANDAKRLAHSLYEQYVVPFIDPEETGE